MLKYENIHTKTTSPLYNTLIWLALYYSETSRLTQITHRPLSVFYVELCKNLNQKSISRFKTSVGRSCRENGEKSSRMPTWNQSGSLLSSGLNNLVVYHIPPAFDIILIGRPWSRNILQELLKMELDWENQSSLETFHFGSSWPNILISTFFDTPGTNIMTSILRSFYENQNISSEFFPSY